MFIILVFIEKTVFLIYSLCVMVIHLNRQHTPAL